MLNRRHIIQGIAATALIGLAAPAIAKDVKPRVRNWRDYVHNTKMTGPCALAFYYDWDKDRAAKKRAIVPQNWNGTLETMQDFRIMNNREIPYETAFYIDKICYTAGNLKNIDISTVMHRYFEAFPVLGLQRPMTNMTVDLEDGRKVHIYNRPNDIAMDGPITVSHYMDNKWGIVRHPYWQHFGYITT